MPKVFCPSLKNQGCTNWSSSYRGELTESCRDALRVSANPDFQKPKEACLTNEFTANVIKTAVALPLLLKTFFNNKHPKSTRYFKVRSRIFQS